MRNSTLCYMEKDGCYLLMHRVKKKNDLNQDKWIGIGGGFEEKESPDDCLLREAREETGLTLTDYCLRGIVTFVSDRWETEQMFLYTATGFEGTLTDCEEGTLEWVPIPAMYDLPIWEGDRIFLRLLEQEAPFFLLKLTYEGDTLTEAILDGHALSL
ncbi:MAG: 8-oxo-dGTP diphosphatase [Ruminococcaceae bacterium]|nr:8-oxo-dGTP diphosphatase [Oscillospiraceae bacterium]